MTDLPHKPKLFIDRNSGGRIFRGFLEAAGLQVVLHDDHFKDRKTPDEKWLKEIGELGWIMITCDEATKESMLFLYALKRSRARVFILDGLDGASRESKAQCIIDCYEKMVEICRRREPPLFWQFNRLGEATAVNFKRKLGLLRRRAKGFS